MKYKVLINGEAYLVFHGSQLVKISAPPADKKHRAAIEQYIATMNEPILVVENDIATLTFDPVPAQMAQWMVDSKSVYFQTVRLSGGGHKHRTSRYRSPSHHSVRNYFPYDFPLDKNQIYSSLSIPNEEADQNNRLITIEELTQGRIERNVSHLRNYLNHCRRSETVAYFSDWCNQFYLGLLYFDAHSLPILYKMASYNIPIND